MSINVRNCTVCYGISLNFQQAKAMCNIGTADISGKLFGSFLILRHALLQIKIIKIMSPHFFIFI